MDDQPTPYAMLHDAYAVSAMARSGDDDAIQPSRGTALDRFAFARDDGK
jgi:hypothetical protein